MRILRLFHGETFRMQTNASDNYRRLLENMRIRESEDQVNVKQEKIASAFLNSPILKDLDTELREEIRKKVQKVKHLEMCILSTIIHGCFTRDAIIIMKSNDFEKIINFQEIRIGPPVIDFGRLLLTNLTSTDSEIKLNTFCSNAMNKYL